ncbi:hypothetical protein WR25_21573 [Diploscapter pachys]|uniref:BAR domain-containing protein n=1 Tax=Diploscapter pachys TaxID=2018661 RepID=A0A2A2KQ88_9BILA|nr:hypothetical protein WR25_21573 [Diploscapter pachys]
MGKDKDKDEDREDLPQPERPATDAEKAAAKQEAAEAIKNKKFFSRLFIQPDRELLKGDKIGHDKNRNPWELVAYSMRCMKKYHQENEKKTLDRYAQVADKIAQKERHHQPLCRLHIRKMRFYVSRRAEKLNEDIKDINNLLTMVDQSRQQLKSSKTLPEIKQTGERYRKMTIAFNEKGQELQSCYDELPTIYCFHQQEIVSASLFLISFDLLFLEKIRNILFFKELAALHRHKYNTIYEARLRLGYKQ